MASAKTETRDNWQWLLPGVCVIGRGRVERWGYSWVHIYLDRDDFFFTCLVLYVTTMNIKLNNSNAVKVQL